jgi:hypothetical protein
MAWWSCTYIFGKPIIELGPTAFEFHLEHFFAVLLVELFLKVGLDTVPHVLSPLGAMPPPRLEDAALLFGAPLFDGRRDFLAIAVLVLIARISLAAK